MSCKIPCSVSSMCVDDLSETSLSFSPLCGRAVGMPRMFVSDNPGFVTSILSSFTWCREKAESVRGVGGSGGGGQQRGATGIVIFIPDRRLRALVMKHRPPASNETSSFSSAPRSSPLPTVAYCNWTKNRHSDIRNCECRLSYLANDQDLQLRVYGARRTSRLPAAVPSQSHPYEEHYDDAKAHCAAPRSHPCLRPVRHCS